MIKRRLERVAVTLLSAAMLLSSTGIAASFAVNDGATAGSTTVISSSTETTSTAVSQEGGAISATTVVTEGGTLVSEEKGSGTASDPYRISDASDLLKMQEKINTTTSANKYFVLTDDIDLSEVKAEHFLSNSVYAGSLVSVSKNLSSASNNVFFSLDGNGHKLKGLNVTFSKGESFAIFGYLNSRSTIKNLIVEKCAVNVTTDAKNGAILVAENDGTISGCEINYPVLSMKNTAYAGIVTAVNSGTISDVKLVGTQTNASGASASSHTISAAGTVGAVAGLNSGKLTSVSAINIGTFINPSLSGKTVYGGIVGSGSGTVSNSFASGNVTGGKATDFVGGIAGTAAKGAKFVNNYILVALRCSASGNGLVGSGATSDMLTDCYWSSAVSGRTASVTDYGTDINDIDTLRFKTVKAGETVTVSSSDLSASWGKASLAFKEGFTKSGDGITVSATADSAKIKGVTAGTVGRLSYTAEIALPSSIGTGDLRVAQYFSLPVLVVSSSSDGKGTEYDPLVIDTSADFNLLRYAHGIYAKLGRDLSVNGSAFAFNGSLDGNGHTISVTSPVFSELFGAVKNISFLAKSDISSAVLGKAFDVKASNVAVTVADGSKLNASDKKSGVMFSEIIGASVLDDCRVKAEVNIAAEVDSFGGLAGEVNGSGTTITNSGAAVNIGSSNKAVNAAGFIGAVNASNVTIENCYASGKNEAGKYLFLASIKATDTQISNIYLNKGAQTALDFTKYGFVDKSEFMEWSFESGETAFFTGNGGEFTAVVPSVKSMVNSSAADYSVSCDSAKLNARVTAENGTLVLKVTRASGVITVKGCPVTVTNKKTGLYTTVYVSNGLEKDGAGNYVITSAYDFAYIGENISELNASSFVVNSDIDMSVISSFEPIGGTLAPFSGKLNGNGHKISGLKIDGTSKSGLFASLENAEISNLVISGAEVKTKGLYSAVLAGQIVGNTKLNNITVSDSKVFADGIYSGIIAGSADSGNLTATDINVIGSTVISKANYVGAFAGHVNCGGSVSDIYIEKITLGGAEYVGGVIGLAEGTFSVKNAAVADAKLKGVSEISGIAAGKGEVSLTDVKVIGSDISTLAHTSAFVAGGIASSFGSAIDSAEVRNTKVTAGIASAVVGKSVSDAKLAVNNIKVYGSTVKAENANTVAAGILSVHNAGGAAILKDCYIDAETAIMSTAVSAGVVGEITGSESALSANGIKSFANVECLASADAVASAGLVAKLSAGAVNNVSFNDAKILGKVSGNAVVGGLIGLVKGSGSFNGASAVVSESVCAAQINTDASNGKAGVVIGFVDNEKTISSENIDLFVKDTVISTYFGNASAFGQETGIKSAKITDMDKPNGLPIQSSVETLTTSSETQITLSNLPTVKGYTFDSATGWVSEASDRISVVSSSEDKLVLKAEHMADISIVAYYVLDLDSEVRIPVHFAIKSNVRTPLKGEGTAENPYLISNAYDLESVAYYDSLGKHFALAEDIGFKTSDFDFGGGFYNVGNGVVTIGNAESGFKGTFTGLYNGKVHSINGLKLSGNTFGGLFGATDGAVISDLVINNADVTGLNYAGVVVGSAKDTVIRNITINSSSAYSSEFGSTAGILVGTAENVTAENITISKSSASSTLSATSATVETAGGVAGVFSGKLSNIQLDSISVKSGTVAGGAVGTASDSDITGVAISGTVEGYEAGGIIGKLDDPVGTSVSGCYVSGTVKAEKLAAGAIAEVGSGLAKLEKPLISETVISAKAQAETSAAVIAQADISELSDSRTAKTEIISDVYYSSYQNDSVFGTQELNSFQNLKFTAVDLSAMKCVIDSTEKSFITLDGEKTVIADEDIVLSAGNGTYKSFELCGRRFDLASVHSDPDGVLNYNAVESSINAVGTVDGAKLVFTYSDGLETAMSVSYSSLLSGFGTKSEPYRIGTADEFALMMQNGDRAGVYYLLTDDIDLSGLDSAESFAGILDGGNHVVYDFSGSSLFENVSGTVKNIGFVGFDIDGGNSESLGAVAGTLDGAVVENCVVIADINAYSKAQDAGIIAGRAINGTRIENCVTSGRVQGASLIAAGGLVGAAYNSQIDSTVSTAFVSVGGYAGGLVGEAEYTKLSNSIFGNMVKSSDGKSGNIAGRFAGTSSADNVLFDGSTATDRTAAFEGETDAMKEASTKALSAPSVVGFSETSGYAVPAALNSTERSAKLATAVEFAAMTVKYISGMNVGTAMNYTDIKVPAEVNSNAVSVDRSNGLTITLMRNKDFASADNTIARYAEPSTENSVKVSYSVTDSTKDLGGKLIGVMLKSKHGSDSNSFSFFTEVGSEIRDINYASVADGKLYVDLSLPTGYGYKVKATDSDGKSLKVKDMKNEGKLVEIGNSDSVTVSVEIVEAKPSWGIRSIWSVIGK